MSRKANEQNLEPDELNGGINDSANLMEQLLQLKMSAETKNSIEHVNHSGEILRKTGVYTQSINIIDMK